jgi:hypothetical protein
MNNRVVLYASYTSKVSVEDQFRAMEKVVDGKGYEVVDRYSDLKKESDSQDELDRLVCDSGHDIFDKVMVYDMDSLNRIVFVAILFKIVINSVGVDVESATKDIENYEGLDAIEQFMKKDIDYHFQNDSEEFWIIDFLKCMKNKEPIEPVFRQIASEMFEECYASSTTKVINKGRKSIMNHMKYVAL